MNKTLTVNIGGIVFHIEEHAYEKLRKYLDAIKAYFTSSDGRDEIIQDIEARIAEMFQERIKSSQQPILENDVDDVINIMGKPEQFADETKDDNQPGIGNASSYNTFTARNYRRIYRDPEDRVIGGVCSGISYRLGIDPIWLRLGFALAFLAMGTGLLLYIILMIILPKAVTPAEKLEMRGEPVNIENIKKSVAEEMESIKGKMNDYASSAKNYSQGDIGKRTGSFLENFFETLLDILKSVLKFAVKVFAVFMLLIGLLVFGGLCIALFAVLGVGGIQVPIFITNYFLTGTQQFWTFIALFLLLGVPFLMLIYKGIKILFGIRYESSMIRNVSGSLFVIGLIVSLILAFSISGNFRVRDTSTLTMPIMQPAGDTLYVGAIRNEKYDHGFGFRIDSDDDFSVISGELDSILRIRKVRLDIQKASGDSFELVKMQIGRGSTRREAEINSNKMNYKFEQQDSLLLLDESFSISQDVKFRNQQIRLILKVPVGKTIFLEENAEQIIYDIDNVSNTYDRDMIGHYWMMTAKGLKCSDFDFSTDEETSGNDSDNNHHIIINGKEIDISTDAKVKIDKNGIDIKDDKNNVHVKVDEHGVKVEDKGKNK